MSGQTTVLTRSDDLEYQTSYLYRRIFFSCHGSTEWSLQDHSIVEITTLKYYKRVQLIQFGHAQHKVVL